MLLLALLSPVPRGWAHAAPAPPDSTPEPPLEFTAPNGQTARLSDFKGQVVLVDIWASWCPPCKSSFPSLDALYQEFHSQGLAVLAVSVDERRRDAEAFLSRHPHQMQIFLDPKGRTPEAFGVSAMPSSFLIDRRGNVRFRHTGYTPATLGAYREEISTLLEEGGEDSDAIVVIGEK
jgi:cytochrome c biogenesis protein CcmG/thiol:disulfide interchange protein DsbE